MVLSNNKENENTKGDMISMSLDELSQIINSVQRPAPPPSGLGNPGPLGLGGFAMTTMVLSIYNAQIVLNSHTVGVVLPLALFYGGIAQFIAGLYEYKINNTFGATAFCSYGAFWCSFAGYVYYIEPTLDPDVAHESTGVFLFVWTIFTVYMFFGSVRVSLVLGVLFFFLSITFILLTAGAWGQNENTSKAGGYFGIVTAGIAWYGSAANLINSTWNRTLLPVGVWVQPKAKPEPDAEFDLEVAEMEEVVKDPTTTSSDDDVRDRRRTLKLSISSGKFDRPIKSSGK